MNWRSRSVRLILRRPSVAGNVVAVGPQAGKSFVKHYRHPLTVVTTFLWLEGPGPSKNLGKLAVLSRNPSAPNLFIEADPHPQVKGSRLMRIGSGYIRSLN